MVQCACYVRRVLHKTRRIFSRINGPNEFGQKWTEHKENVNEISEKIVQKASQEVCSSDWDVSIEMYQAVKTYVKE